MQWETQSHWARWAKEQALGSWPKKLRVLETKKAPEWLLGASAPRVAECYSTVRPPLTAKG